MNSRLGAAVADSPQDTTARPQGLAALLREAFAENPGAAAARASWLAALQEHPQATALPDPMFQYMREENGYELMLSQMFPARGMLRIKGSMADARAEMARLNYEMTVRDLVTDMRTSYAELQYLDRAIELTTQNLALGTADLLLLKTDGETVVQPGQTLNYVLTVVNEGSITAESVTLEDTLPPYLTYQGWATNDSGITLTSATNPYRWSLGDLAVGVAKSITLTASVAISLPNGTTTLSNYAHVTTTSPEADITNNERADTDTVTAHPDLTLFKSATSDSVPITQGSTITYTYTGDNRGYATATGVTITDTLDANTTYVAGSAVLVVGGSTWPVTATYIDSSKTLVLELPNMPPGAEGYLRYRATVADPLPQGVTLITNTAQVTSHETDLNPANNQSTLVLSAESGADIYVDKVGVSAANPAVPGSEVVYLLRYGNLGDQAASSVVLTDAIPANTALVAGSITGGGTESGGVITWSLGDLAVGASGQVSFTVRINDVLPAGGAAPNALISACSILSRVCRNTTAMGPTRMPMGPSACTPPSTLSRASSGCRRASARNTRGWSS